MELVEKTGVCRFCGQNKIVEVPDNFTDEEINEEATKECYCIDAKHYKKSLERKAMIEQQKMSVRGAILEQFHEKYPEIEELLNSAIDPLAVHKFKKVSVTTDDGVRAALKWNSGIEIEKADTNITKIKMRVDEIDNA